MITVKYDWDAVEWTETGDRTFFGMHRSLPVVKIVCKERTYIIPACHISQVYREIAFDIIENGVQRGAVYD